MVKRVSWSVVVLFLLTTFTSFGQSRTWKFAIAGGAVKNFSTPLSIEQNNAEAIKLDANYRTEPFNPPVYYDIRIATVHQDKGWELKFTHHKLILKNLPQDVQRFSITDGFNLLTINRLWLYRGFTWSVGGGVVITHPESTVRNQPYPENKGLLDEGYYISGPTAEAAIAKRYSIGNRWFILGEGRMTASYVVVPISDGNARVTNVALHGLLGFGMKLNAGSTDKNKSNFY